MTLLLKGLGLLTRFVRDNGSCTSRLQGLVQRAK